MKNIFLRFQVIFILTIFFICLNNYSHATPIEVAPIGSLFPIVVSLDLRSLYCSKDSSYYLSNSVLMDFSPSAPAIQGGQWTSFYDSSVPVNQLVSVLYSGNPTPVSLNTFIWTMAGSSTTLFKGIQEYLLSESNRDVLLPVIQTWGSSQPEPQLIVDFIGFHFDSLETNKLYGHFVDEALISDYIASDPVSSVPEPSSSILLLLGLVPFILLRKHLIT